MFRVLEPWNKRTFRRTHVQVSSRRRNKRMFRRKATEKSDEGAAGEIVHYRADDCVGGDSFEQRRAAGDDRHSNDQDGPDDGDDLFDAFFAGADSRDMLADTCAALGTYAAALDDQVTPALGTFDFGSQRHRGYEPRRYELPNSRASAYESEEPNLPIPSPVEGEPLAR
jgi:hypothetical protein